MEQEIMILDISKLRKKDRFMYVGEVLHKRCTRCLTFKNLEFEFTKDKHTVDGRTTTCTECRNSVFQDPANRKKYYKAGGDKNKQRYYQENKDRIHKVRQDRLKSSHELQVFKRYKNTARKHRLFEKTRKGNKSIAILGCSKEFLLEHLNQKFTEVYNIPYSDLYFEDLHIDHIIPISSAKTEERLIELCHYLNLQFLHKDHNMEKKDKINYIVPEFPIERYNK